MTPTNRRGRWGSSDWEEFPPSAPIPVDGGLTARSARGGIGEQWWSKRFIEVLESFAMGGRLTRGRAYARKGQVISMEVEPGEVTASVQGSRVTPYKVRIGLPKFSELIWAKAEVVLAEQAIHSARLLAGEFPPELEPVFAGIGAPLFPARLGDLALSCSCPDHMIPCKHLAAVFYLLAERFDDDPFLILRWRGRPREVLLRRLRELRGDEPGSDRPGEAVRDGSDSGDDRGDGAGGDRGVRDGGTDVDPPLPAVLSAALALGLRANGNVSGSRAPGEPGVGVGREAVGGEPESGASVAAAGKKAAGEGTLTVLPVGGLDAALSFWTGGPTPPLPSRPELPVDLLLRLLPVPGAALGGSRLLKELGPLYDQLAGSAPDSRRAPRHGNLGS